MDGRPAPGEEETGAQTPGLARQHIQALRDLESLPDDPAKSVKERIEELRRQHKIKASVAAIHRWWLDHQKVLADQRDADLQTQAANAIRAFQQLASAGVVGEAAISRVLGSLDQSLPRPNLETLKAWQEKATWRTVE